MDQSCILEIKELTKQFEETMALNHINLKLERGKVYGLIGRNGAGKTTLLKLIGRLLFPTEGEVAVNSDWIKEKTEISFGRAYSIRYFSYKIKDILKIAAFSSPNWNEEYAGELIERFELNTKKYYHSASAGMQTMTSLVLALAADPQLLLLDEPYIGLDPINREVLYDFLRHHYFDGEKTVVISSHMIKEIEGYFERAVILDKGRLLLNEEVETLKEQSFIISADAVLAGVVEESCKVLDRESLGRRSTYYVYGRLSEQQREQILAGGGELQSMDLQTLMIKMLTRKERI